MQNCTNQDTPRPKTMSDYQEYPYRSTEGGQHLEYIRPVLLELLGPPANQTILDLGCGNGALAGSLLEAGYNIYGTDASESGIRFARERYPGRFFLQNLDHNALPAELSGVRFNHIILTEVIEHLYAPRQIVAFCKEILRQNGGGQVILSTPYHGYWKNLLLALTGKMDDHFTALWDGGHIKFWSRKTLTALLEEQGFKVTQFKGAGRIPFLWKSMLIKAVLEQV